MAEYQNLLQDPIPLCIIKTHLKDYKSDIKVKKSDIKIRVREKSPIYSQEVYTWAFLGKGVNLP